MTTPITHHDQGDAAALAHHLGVFTAGAEQLDVKLLALVYAYKGICYEARGLLGQELWGVMGEPLPDDLTDLRHHLDAIGRAVRAARRVLRPMLPPTDEEYPG